MITRYYECTKCEHKFTQDQKLHDPIRKRCPKCKGKVFQDLTGIYGKVDNGPKTLIQKAERNTKKMGKYEIQEKERMQRLQKKKQNEDALKNAGLADENFKLPDPDSKPWFGKLDKDKKKKLFSGTPKEIAEKQKKYIVDGV